MISLGRLLHVPLFVVQTWPMEELQMQQAYDFMQSDAFEDIQAAEDRKKQLEMSGKQRAEYARNKLMKQKNAP